MTALTGSPTTPIILGEFSASQVHLEPAARWAWTDHVVRTAAAHAILPILWDNGLDNLQRETGLFRDPVAVAIILTHAVQQRAGVTVANLKLNALPGRTTDPSATTQSSSALVFSRVGEPVTADWHAPLQLNGNTVAGLAVTGAGSMKEGADYLVDHAGQTITLTRAFLSRYLGGQEEDQLAEPSGQKANVTVRFSAGADTLVELVKWDVPTLAFYSASVHDLDAAGAGSATGGGGGGGDLDIPVRWRGLRRPAAVRMVKADGTYLVDDWTVGLPELQKGRGVSFASRAQPSSVHNHRRVVSRLLIMVMDRYTAATGISTTTG